MFTKDIRINNDIYDIELRYSKGKFSITVLKNNEELGVTELYNILGLNEKPVNFSFSSLLDANWCFINLVNLFDKKSNLIG